MDFLVQFKVNVPPGTPDREVQDRERAEASTGAKLENAGQLLRVWKVPVGTGAADILGLYRADSSAELETLLRALPLYEWMQVTVTSLESHPNDPGTSHRQPTVGAPGQAPNQPNHHLPDPRLRLVYRLEAAVAQPQVLGEVSQGQRRIVPLTGGSFAGPEISGHLVPGASADWQIIQSDGTALGDIRYTLQTASGALLYVQSQSVRHGPAEVLARLGRGEDVDASEYTFRTSTRIETSAPELEWLNKGIFVSVGGRQAAAVVYETYLVE